MMALTEPLKCMNACTKCIACTKKILTRSGQDLLQDSQINSTELSDRFAQFLQRDMESGPTAIRLEGRHNYSIA